MRLVPERYLRQVLHYLIDWGHTLPSNLDQPYWVARSDLVDGRLLPEHFLNGTEPRLLLITDPNDRMLDHLPLAAQLREYWRVLFRAAVIGEIDRKLETGVLTESDCLVRLERFGLATAREIRFVLLEEHLIARSAALRSAIDRSRRRTSNSRRSMALPRSITSQVFLPMGPFGKCWPVMWITIACSPRLDRMGPPTSLANGRQVSESRHHYRLTSFHHRPPNRAA